MTFWQSIAAKLTRKSMITRTATTGCVPTRPKNTASLTRCWKRPLNSNRRFNGFNGFRRHACFASWLRTGSGAVSWLRHCVAGYAVLPIVDGRERRYFRIRKEKGSQYWLPFSFLISFLLTHSSYALKPHFVAGYAVSGVATKPPHSPCVASLQSKRVCEIR